MDAADSEQGLGHVGLKHASKQRRVLLHNPNGRLSDRLLSIWKDAQITVERTAREYWTTTIREMGLECDQQAPPLIDQIVSLEEARFTNPFDTEWVDLVTEAATELNRCGAAPSQIAHAFGAFAIRLGSALRHQWPQDQQRLWSSIEALQAKASAEIEIALAVIALREKQLAAEAVRGTAEQFTAAMSAQVGTALSISGTLRETASGTAGTARQMLSSIADVASAAEQLTATMAHTAAATGSLTAAMSEARSKVAETADAASLAAKEASNANRIAHDMLMHAETIESILSVIRRINKQINLLSLNASIEAARAGELGRTFTVVAQEVKALATQTGTATEDIAVKAAAIQAAAKQTADASALIEKNSANVHERAEAVNTIIERQNDAIRMIADAVRETSVAAGTISEEMGAMRSSITQVSANFASVDEAVRMVDEEIHKLHIAADDFAAAIAFAE